MRLIDADLLTEEIKSLRCTLIGLRAGKGILARAADEYQKSILQIIEQQPTAFDKEKVIEELKKYADIAFETDDAYGSEVAYGEWTAYKQSAKIVEKGGIE